MHRIICSVHLSFSILSILLFQFLRFSPFFLPQAHLFVLYTSFRFALYFVTSFLHEISHLFFEFIPRDYANNFAFANRNCLDFKLRSTEVLINVHDVSSFSFNYSVRVIYMNTTCVNFNDCTRICKLHASFSEQVIFSLEKERRSRVDLDIKCLQRWKPI